MIDAGVGGRVDSGVAECWEGREGRGVEVDMLVVDGVGSMGSVCTAFSFTGNEGGKRRGSEAEWLESDAEGTGEFPSLPGRGGKSAKLRDAER
jgi:hypothetical protein